MLFKKKHYMDWQEYEAYVNQIDELFWRQSVREASIANL